MKMEPITYQDFSGGVIQNLPASKLGRTVSPRAWNSAIQASRGGSMMVTKRPGFQRVAQTPIAPVSTAIVSQGFYHYTENNQTTVHHIAVVVSGPSALGLIYELHPDDEGGSVLLPLPTGPKEFATESLDGILNGTLFIQGQQSQILIGLVRNGTCFKIYRKPGSSTLYVGTLGLPAPYPFVTTAIGGTPGNMYGDLEVRMTYLNTDTGTESSACAEVVIPLAGDDANRKWGSVTVTNPADTPAEATAICVYIRVPRLRTDFYRDATLQYARGTAEFAGTTPIILNYTDDQVSGMQITGPGLHEYDPPASSLLCGCWHLQRLFASDGIRVFYSKAGNPEQFDGRAVEIIGTGGQLTLGLMPLNDQSLGVFKERSIHELVGADPQIWDQNELVPDRGCISTLSLTKGDGKIAFWSEEGPCVWDKVAEPVVISNETIKPFAEQGFIYLKRRDKCQATFDPFNHRFLFTLDGAFTWTVAPWSTIYSCWESLAWDMEPIFGLTTGPSKIASENRVFFAQGPVSYEMSSTLRTDAASDEDGSLWARVVSANGTTSVVLDRSGPFAIRISNSRVRCVDARTLSVYNGSYFLAGNVLTWAPQPDFIPTPGSPVIFDSAVMEWDTIDETNDQPLYEKRALQTYLELRTKGDTPFNLGLVRDNEVIPIRTWGATIAANDKAALPWGPFMTGTVKTFKRWAGVRYQWMRSRFIGWYPSCNWGLTQVGWQAVVQDDEK